jgi:glutaconate CoA-transferase subunit B
VSDLPIHTFMAVVMAREVRDDDWVSHGASVPLAGAALFTAMETHAPNAEFWMQGCVTPSNRNLADALTSPEKIYPTAKAFFSQQEIIDFSLRGGGTFQYLRPLQIDPYGNVNVSMVERGGGRPPLRFHGIAIGDAVNAVRRVCFYVTEHSPRVFVEELPFRTATGHHDGSEWRPAAGLHDAGPESVITPLAVLEFDAERRLCVRSVHEGVTLAQVQEATGFELGTPAGEVPVTPAPTGEELAALERVDPEGIRRLEFRETRDEVMRYLAERG